MQGIGGTQEAIKDHNISSAFFFFTATTEMGGEHGQRLPCKFLWDISALCRKKTPLQAFGKTVAVSNRDTGQDLRNRDMYLV